MQGGTRGSGTSRGGAHLGPGQGSSTGSARGFSSLGPSRPNTAARTTAASAPAVTPLPKTVRTQTGSPACISAAKTGIADHIRATDEQAG
ncbi:hypothetical protein OOK13_06055 [Streptomyces sp. NBC_00378]|uniref:hypothetical protein n=1 Tax=unclassified Streptomyces TaxID=2593676 RepID=UPI0022561F51|nr:MULTISPECIES: hypothetical protein [unclassified Streptomyces]MCX5108089.1 hypothetical protein [Streptomyces sp. NBC_00378]